jgi:hypothetical protein
MKRLLTAATVAGAAMMGPSPAEAAPLDNPMCADVFTDTPQDVPSELRSAISTYAMNGVSVHVQILQNGGAKGIHEKADTGPYAQRLVDQCDWDDSNLINVVVSDDPRTYAIYKSGNAATLITQRQTDDAEATFKANLQDTRQSYLIDSATLLRTIDPYKNNNAQPSHIQQPNRPPRVEAATPAEDHSAPFPWLTVGGGIVGALALGAGGLRLKRGYDIRQDSNRSDDLAGETWSETLIKVQKATELLGALHADDAANLRTRAAEVAQLSNDFEERRKRIRTAYLIARSRVWPDRDELLNKISQLNADGRNLRAKTIELDAVTAEIEDFMVHIDANVDDMTKGISEAHSEAGVLLKAGWDIGTYNVDLLTLDGQQATVLDLRDKHYVQRPGQMVKDIKPAAKALQSALKELPSLREQADQVYSGQAAEIVRLQSIADSSVASLSELRATYDPSCYKDIDALDQALAGQLRVLADLRLKGGEYTGLKTKDAVDQSSALNEQFATNAQLLETVAGRSHERAQRLHEIKAELPDRVAAISSSLDGLRKFAFDVHASDVEDDVREGITSFTQAFAEAQFGLGEDKPKYLDLDKAFAAHQEAVSGLIHRAQAQKQEMDTLRSNVIELEGTLRSELSSLRSYVSNGDVGHSIKSSAVNLSIMSGDIRDTRSGLRGQVQGYRALRSQIDEIKSAARRDIQAAESAREAERQRIIAEQQAIAAAAAADAAAESARQAAQAAASSPPPTTNDPGTF